MLTHVFVLVDWILVSVALQDNIRPQASEKVSTPSQLGKLLVVIGQSLHAIKRPLYERLKADEKKRFNVRLNSHERGKGFSLILYAGVYCPITHRCHGRTGAGGWQRRAGARLGLEAGSVDAGSASPGGPR